MPLMLSSSQWPQDTEFIGLFCEKIESEPLTFRKSCAVLVDTRPIHSLLLSDLVQYLWSIMIFDANML